MSFQAASSLFCCIYAIRKQVLKNSNEENKKNLTKKQQQTAITPSKCYTESRKQKTPVVDSLVAD